MGCRLIGQWRIVEADLWDDDYLDLVALAPATLIIEPNGHGEIAFGAMQAGLDLEYAPSMVFFTWAGFDEMDEVTGSGVANGSTTPRSKSISPTTSATRPSSKLSRRLLQQSASGMQRQARY
ncbi:hypothetical protein ABIE65_005184 [Constrictibacter sp. MBR-5]|uniref:hypothetical protein n=1 Tax=Constrictibacter sp. MBR-5 TaxID=3156467 RepID=UPI0033916D49